ncbi:MAG: GMC family oxidoreductase N-terminal domain-containing protein [Candidatus Omnitrophica bacterium]|nr:GMC family oxidoreductase N-terminal domain-containing protein [Candidatus Omnitrophota bacterium]MBU1906368.1 GMC family oxidoreductase N-terminal domain-containing protein [Candidatus Omnitrophota bacterium]
MELSADIIIVGSGVGGTTIAKELAGGGKKILIVEKGRYFSEKQLGSVINGLQFYDRQGLRSKTKEGIFYYRTIMAGGTSVVSCANGVRSLEKKFKKMGIDLRDEFRETEKELAIKSVPNRYLGKGTKEIIKAANSLGITMKPMPKFINFGKCIMCGNCYLGCNKEAKWSALEYLKKAQKKGASLLTRIDVKRVIVSKGKAIGIECTNKIGLKIKLFAKIIILAAGGIETPIILQNSGIKAGRKLFLDLFNVTIGLTEDKGLTNEIPMAAISNHKGFVLSPFIDNRFALASTIPLPLRRNLKLTMHRKHMLGIMVKIDDDSVGRVHKNGLIEKKVTPADKSKLNKGVRLSKKILIKAGVTPNTIITTKTRGAHPGGTAAIGEVVNKNLETKTQGLFVCDASVLPVSPGVPPIVTIIALGKRLSKFLNKHYHF